MTIGCVFYYTWIPPALSWVALLFFAMTCFASQWRGGFWVIPLAIWLWISQASPAAAYYGAFSLLVGAYRLQLRSLNPGQSQMPRACAYLVAGYLAYVGIPAWLGVPPRITYWCTFCRSNLANLSQALDLFYADHKRLPACLEELTPSYLTSLPHCLSTPTGSEAAVFYRYSGLELADDYGYRRYPQGNYVLWCRNLGLPGHPDYCRYDSRPDATDPLASRVGDQRSDELNAQRALEAGTAYAPPDKGNKDVTTVVTTP